MHWVSSRSPATSGNSRDRCEIHFILVCGLRGFRFALPTLRKAPYSYTWKNIASGTYSLTAKATDDKGETATSAARTVRVAGAAQAREIYYIHSDHLNVRTG